MLHAHPTANLAAAVVWIPMLGADDERAAAQASALVPDKRVRHFYDAERQAGRAIARSLGTDGAAGQVAWDMYLFYDRRARWHAEHAEAPPAPTDWVHQQRGRAWADERRWRWGEDLTAALAAITGREFAP